MQQEMKYVYQVYLDGSFSKAAEHLYMTQPALSIAVQKLESALGMPVFDRGTRPLSLTPAGEVYIETIRQTLFLEQEMQRHIEDIRTLNSGSLLIGGSHYLNACILPEVLTGFNRAYPKIRLELVETGSDQLVRMLAERALDLTFNCDPRVLPNFKRYPAFYDHILLAVPRCEPLCASLASPALTSEDIAAGKHLSQACPTVNLARFKELEFLLLTGGNNLHERGLQLFEEAGFAPKIKMEVSQLVTAYRLAEHALAATFVSDRLVAADGGRLCYYKLDSKLTQRLFYILLPERKYTSFAVQAFVRYFTQHMLQTEGAPLQGDAGGLG